MPRQSSSALKRHIVISGVMAAVSSAWMASAPAQAAEVNCQYHTKLEYEMKMPVYRWAPEGAPKGVVLALHGLVMHGTCFDVLGKGLAEQGFLVYSTDMRGYGRLKKEYPHEFCSDHDCKQKINYEKSARDLTALAEKIRAEHPDVPLYIVGESLGADMAIRIAGSRPNVPDGLILSAPAIRAHVFVDKHTPVAASAVMWNFRHQLDMTPYLKKYASQDPEVVDELTHDDLVRKRLSIYEIFVSRAAVMKSLNYVPGITADKPVLVVMAHDDKCVRTSAVPLLTSKLKSKDTKVCWFDNRGHILIETAHIKPDTMELIVSWLNDHASRAQVRAQAPAVEGRPMANVIAETTTGGQTKSD